MIVQSCVFNLYCLKVYVKLFIITYKGPWQWDVIRIGKTVRRITYCCTTHGSYLWALAKWGSPSPWPPIMWVNHLLLVKQRLPFAFLTFEFSVSDFFSAIRYIQLEHKLSQFLFGGDVKSNIAITSSAIYLPPVKIAIFCSISFAILVCDLSCALLCSELFLNELCWLVLFCCIVRFFQRLILSSALSTNQPRTNNQCFQPQNWMIYWGAIMFGKLQ